MARGTNRASSYLAPRRPGRRRRDDAEAFCRRQRRLLGAHRCRRAIMIPPPHPDDGPSTPHFFPANPFRRPRGRRTPNEGGPNSAPRIVVRHPRSDPGEAGNDVRGRDRDDDDDDVRPSTPFPGGSAHHGIRPLNEPVFFHPRPEKGGPGGGEAGMPRRAVGGRRRRPRRTQGLYALLYTTTGFDAVGDAALRTSRGRRLR